MRGQDAVAAAIDEPEHVIFRDLLAEADATRAKDAALVIQCDAWAEFDVLRLLHFIFEEARLRIAVLDAEFLQPALTGLIADGAVEWVINEEEFHHAAPAFFDER